MKRMKRRKRRRKYINKKGWGVGEINKGDNNDRKKYDNNKITVIR